MKKSTLFIDYDGFVKWYFDEDTVEEVIDTLIEDGEISMEECLKEVGFLPRKLVTNPENLLDDELKIKELEEPGNRYKLEFA